MDHGFSLWILMLLYKVFIIFMADIMRRVHQIVLFSSWAYSTTTYWAPVASRDRTEFWSVGYRQKCPMICFSAGQRHAVQRCTLSLIDLLQKKTSEKTKSGSLSPSFEGDIPGEPPKKENSHWTFHEPERNCYLLLYAHWIVW